MTDSWVPADDYIGQDPPFDAEIFFDLQMPFDGWPTTSTWIDVD